MSSGVDKFERREKLPEPERVEPAPAAVPKAFPEDIELQTPEVMSVEDYQNRFMQDAYRKAHDAELAALASLAVIRSRPDNRNRMMARLEMDMMLSPYGVSERLGDDEGKK